MIGSVVLLWLRQHRKTLLLAALAALLAGVAYTSIRDAGYRSAATKYEARIAAHALADVAAARDAQARARSVERAHATALAELNAQHQKEQVDAAIKTERTVADLRAGTLRLRHQLAAQPVNLPATDTSGSSGTFGPGLRPEDAEFLVREADRADAVVRDLNACNAARQVDRSAP